jgi:hypothetical protein
MPSPSRLGSSIGALVVAGLAMGAAAGSFMVVDSPSPNRVGNTINAVAAISATDAWAVGYRNSNNVNESRTLTQHWDGRTWSTVPSPNPATTLRCFNANTGNWLNSVAAVSANDVWAVGYKFPCTAVITPLILHWNGVRWSEVPSPALNTNDNSALLDVVALSANNVYAVGYHPAPNGAVMTLVERWDGQAWSVIPTPNLSPTGCVLWSIAVTPNGELWAVGDSVDEPTTSIQTLALHSVNGTTWEIVPTPNPLPKSFLNQNALTAVTAPAADDVTAVGFLLDFNHQRTLTLIQHWDGESWQTVTSPNPSSANDTLNTLMGVTALSPTNLYAVGWFANGNTGGQHRSLIEHFDGTTWSVVTAPPSGITQQLHGVTGVPASNNVWIGGAFSTHSINAEFGLLQIPQTLFLLAPEG